MSVARSRFSATRTPKRQNPVLLPNRSNTILPPQQPFSNSPLMPHRPTSLTAPSKRPNHSVIPSRPAGAKDPRWTPTTFALTLPLPPSINHQYATVRGRRILSSGRRYKAEIGKLVGSIMKPSADRQRFLHDLQSHFLRLALHFYFPTLLRRDLDGGLKIAQDALCQALGINDNRIMEVHLLKSADSDFPRMECTLSLLNPAPKTRKVLSRKPGTVGRNGKGLIPKRKVELIPPRNQFFNRHS